MDESYQFWGMHLIWWLVWAVLLIWIFATPYHVPGERSKKDSPMAILKKRLAAGEIDSKEFQEKKNLIEKH